MLDTISTSDARLLAVIYAAFCASLTAKDNKGIIVWGESLNEIQLKTEIKLIANLKEITAAARKLENFIS
jgi:hypothetical protein